MSLSRRILVAAFLAALVGVSAACGAGGGLPYAYWRSQLSAETGTVGEKLYFDMYFSDVPSTAPWHVYYDTDLDFATGSTLMGSGTGNEVIEFFDTSAMAAGTYYVAISTEVDSQTYWFTPPSSFTLTTGSLPGITITAPTAPGEYIIGATIPLGATVTNGGTFTWELLAGWDTDPLNYKIRIATLAGSTPLSYNWATSSLTPSSYYIGFVVRHGDFFTWAYTPFLITITVHDQWQAMSADNAPEARYDHGAVWTGTQYFVWGGRGATSILSSGGLYSPWDDSWEPVSNTNAPTPRTDFSTVWCSDRVIVWGGQGSGTYLDTGSMYFPASDTWADITTVSAPEGRKNCAAVWTGAVFLVWGGYGDTGYLNDGAFFNPSTGAWTAISSTNAPSARQLPAFGWTGSELVIWGGSDSGGALNSGGIWNWTTNSWRTMTVTGAPNAREDAFSTYSLSRGFIVWGGKSADLPASDGGIYDPGTDTWSAIPAGIDAPGPYNDRSVAYTGKYLFAWGGDYLGYNGAGSEYNFDTGVWSAVTETDAPDARSYCPAVFTGSVIILWGGSTSLGPVSSGAYYFP
ncbi:MAG: hypothetical protein WC712_05520 [Candidatus Brocadiia bacterium]